MDQQNGNKYLQIFNKHNKFKRLLNENYYLTMLCVLLLKIKNKENK